MGTSFNSTTLQLVNDEDTPQTLNLELTSLTFTGGDIPAVDVTSASDTRRKQKPGIRAPYQLQIEGHAPSRSTFILTPGAAIDFTIGGNAAVHMGSTGTNWYLESSEITGNIDESITVSLTLTEGAASS